MPPNNLSFAWLEKRLRAVPEGPSANLTMPTWAIVWLAIGTAGALLGLAPSVMIKLMTPQMWMATMAKTGLWIEVAGYAPVFIRMLLLLVRDMWNWRQGVIEQWDHDLAQFRVLSNELARLPGPAIAEHLRFARDGQARLASKASLMFGSVDRLGFLPVAVAIALQIKTMGDVSALPAWQALLGIFFAVQYLIAILMARMKLRLQLYEMVLTDVLQKQAAGLAAGTVQGFSPTDLNRQP